MKFKFSLNFSAWSWTHSLKLIVLFNLIISVYPTQSNSNQQHANLETLQMVQILHRHGQRNPLASLGPLHPNDVDQFPRGWGQLTKKGEQETFELGDYLRQRYDSFLSREYNAREIYVVSSDMDRTIQSALSVLRGLYPPVDGDDQIVPLRTVSIESDNIIHFTKNCPRFKQVLAKVVFQSRKIQELEKDGAKLLQQVNHVTGREAKSWSDLIYLMDYIQVLAHQRKPLPDWITPEMLAHFKSYIRHMIHSAHESKELLKFRSPIVHKLIEKMGQMTQGEGHKMTIYSGHDLTLLAVMGILGFPNVDTLPPYASALILELHKTAESDYFVEMYFRNETTAKNGVENELVKLEIPNCGSPCELTRLEQLVAPLFLQNYEEECALNSNFIQRANLDHENMVESCSNDKCPSSGGKTEGDLYNLNQ